MKNSLKWQWFYQKKIYLLAFFIPFLIMYFVYAVFGVHPFGDESVLALDLNGQYVYYFEALRDSVWGKTSVIYSWSRNLSGEMFGIFAYYLASPFTIITIILPRSMMLGALEIMQLCKVGAAALTFAIYLRNRKHSKDFTLLTFSAIYALMSYSVVQLMNPMWLDGLIYLPLIFYGVEVLVDEGRRLNLIIPLALMFMANFYIGYMVGIFTGVYFIFYSFGFCEEFTKKKFLKSSLNFAISAIISVMTAMVIIYPAYNSLKLGKFEFTKPDMALNTQFKIVDFFTKLLPFSYDTVRPEGLPVVFCGSLTLLLIPLYFLNRNIKVKDKITNGILLTFIFLCMYLRTLDIALHGFQVPNWLPYRYSFVFCFVMIVIAAQAFEHLEGITFKEISGAFFGITTFLIFIEGKDYKHFTPLKSFLPAVLIMIIYFAVLNAVKKNKSNSMLIFTLIIVCSELFAVSLQTVYDIDNDVVYSKYSSYKGYIEDGRKTVKMINEQDSSFYRAEKTFHRTVNDNLAFGLKGVSHSSSTMNSPAIELLAKLGFTSRGHYTKYNGGTKVTDSILGIKYVLTKDKTVYDYDLIFSNENIQVHKNPDALSIGYMSSNQIKDTVLFDDNPFVNQNILVNSLIGDAQSDVFKRISINDTINNNVEVSNAGNHTKYTKISEGIDTNIQYLITAPTDDIIYAFFPSKYERTANLWVNNQFIGEYFETENYCIVPLGKFTAGEEINVQMTLTKDELYMQDQCFYYIDKQAFDNAFSKLKENQWDIKEHSDTYLKGEITAKENQIMFTTIPYEDGWRIKVDGKEVKPVKLIDSMIGINVPEGTHTVSMRFFPKYFTVGILASIAGVILIVGVGILDKRSKKLLLNKLYN